MSLEAGSHDLESTIAAARDTTFELRDQAAELAHLLERLEPHGSGPPEVIAEQRRLLAKIEATLRRLRELDRREAELRDG